MAHSAKYLRVLASAAWRELSAMMRRGGTCDACGARVGKGDLQAHHWHYETLGNEEPWDVSPLCSDCHSLADTWRRAIVRAAKSYAATSGDADWRRAARLIGRDYIRLLARPALPGHQAIALAGLRVLLEEEGR